MGKSSLCVRFLRSIRYIANKVKTLSSQPLDTRHYFYFDHMRLKIIVARFPIVTYPISKLIKILISIISLNKIIKRKIKNRTANIVYVQVGFWWLFERLWVFIKLSNY
jgi:hypothetical protein